RALKYGDTFVVVDSHGDIGTAAGGPDGLFFADTRYLSRLELVLRGEQPLLLGSNVRDDNTLLSVDLTNPDFHEDGRIAIEKDLVHLSRTMFLWCETAYQRLSVSNHGDRPLDLDVKFYFDSDFADVFEVRGLKRTRRGVAARKVIAADQVLLSYVGLD